MDTTQARRVFDRQRANAKQRGVEFKMTFEQWSELWGARLDERGVRLGQLVMCRNGDAGAYEAGNVRIDTNSGNMKEHHMLRRVKKHAEASPKPPARNHTPANGAPADWLYRKDVFAPYVEKEEDA